MKIYLVTATISLDGDDYSTKQFKVLAAYKNEKHAEDHVNAITEFNQYAMNELRSLFERMQPFKTKSGRYYDVDGEFKSLLEEVANIQSDPLYFYDYNSTHLDIGEVELDIDL